MSLESGKEIKAYISLGIIQNENGEILIIQRAKEEKGTGEVDLSWAFPGGKIEEEEDNVSACVREVLEETGFSVEINEEISGRKHPQFPVYVHYMSGKLLLPDQEIYDKNEVRDVKWVKPDDLGNYFTTDFDTKVQEFLGIR